MIFLLMSLIITSFFAAQIFTIDLGAFQLSLFRILLFVLVIAVFITKKRYESIPIISKDNNNYSIIFMVIWFIYSYVSFIWTKDLYEWLRITYFIGSGVLCIVIFSFYIKTNDLIYKAFKVIMLMVFVQSIIGWYEIITRNYYFMEQTKENIQHYVNGFERIPIAMLGNPNDFATLMLVGVFVSYIIYSIEKHKMIKLISIVMMISFAILVIVTDSRANIIGLIISVTFFILVKVKQKWKILLYLCGFLAFLFMISPSFVTSIRNAIIDITYLRTDVENAGDIIRLNLLKNAVYFLKESGWFGVGAGSVDYLMTTSGIYFTKNVTNIHNWWIEILSVYGIGIFLGYIIFYIKLFIDMMKIYRNYPNNIQTKSIALAIMCYQVGFIIGSISSSSNLYTEWLWIFWAVCVAFQGINQQNMRTVSYVKKML